MSVQNCVVEIQLYPSISYSQGTRKPVRDSEEFETVETREIAGFAEFEITDFEIAVKSPDICERQLGLSVSDVSKTNIIVCFKNFSPSRRASCYSNEVMNNDIEKNNC